MPLQSPSGPRAVCRQGGGFTTIELLVVVAILGLLAALAAPSFTPLIERWRVRQAAEDFASTLTLARSEAIRRGGRVLLQRHPPDAALCPEVEASTKDWGCGWRVFVDSNRNDTLDDGELLLRTSHAPKGVHVGRSAFGALLRLNRWGEDGMGAYGFAFRPRREGSDVAIAVCVSSGGRIALRTGDSEC